MVEGGKVKILKPNNAQKTNLSQNVTTLYDEDPQTKTLVNKYTTRSGSSWLSSYSVCLFIYNKQTYQPIYTNIIHIYIYIKPKTYTTYKRIRRTPIRETCIFGIELRNSSCGQLSQIFRLPMICPLLKQQDMSLCPML